MVWNIKTLILNLVYPDTVIILKKQMLKRVAYTAAQFT